MEAATVLNRGKADRAAVEKALRAAGIDGPIEMVDGSRITAHVTALVEQGAKRIIVGGGDGSVGAAAQALAGSEAALGILPLGTLNHFARDLGIPFELDRAAALAGRSPRRPIWSGPDGRCRREGG